MIRRLNKLLVFLIFIGLACYAFILNPSSVTVRFSAQHSISAPLAIVLISTFGIGILLTALFALYLGLKAQWRERGFKARERNHQRTHQILLEARGLIAAGEWSVAEQKWQNIVVKNPEDIVARVELSRCLEGRGDLAEALRVLDAARAIDSKNVEVLFRAAEINLALGNKTAALDNLSLIINNEPCARAIVWARNIAEDLGRLDEALHYHQLLSRLATEQRHADEIFVRIRIKQIEANPELNLQKKLSEVRKLSKSYAQQAAPYLKLAELERSQGDIEASVKNLLMASKVTGDPTYWHDAAVLWVKADQPQRAVAAAKSAINDSPKGIARIASELELIKLYLTLDMNDEALESLHSLEPLLESQSLELSSDIGRTFLILKGRCYHVLGNHQEASLVWHQLSESRFELNLDSPSTLKVKSIPELAPSPSLSTP